MYWEIKTLEHKNEYLPIPVVVKAQNWFSALKVGLKRYGYNGFHLVGVTCRQVEPDLLSVRDFVSESEFFIKSLRDVQKQEENFFLNTDDFQGVAAKLLFSKNFDGGQGGVLLGHRAVLAKENITESEIEAITTAVLNDLKADSASDRSLFIRLEFYSECLSFSPVFPPFKVVEFKEWENCTENMNAAGSESAEARHDKNFESKKAMTDFILAGGAKKTAADFQGDTLDNVEVEKVEPETERNIVEPMAKKRSKKKKNKNKKIHQEKAFVASAHIEQKTSTSSEEISVLKEVSHQVKEVSHQVVDTKESDLKEPEVKFEKKKIRSAVMAIEDGIMLAFEKMQEMYSLKKHDAVAEFALDVSMELVPAKAGVFVLTAPGKDELYVSAFRGFENPAFSRRRFSMRKGLIGFVVANSCVVNLSNPLDDKRFIPGEDIHGDFDIDSLLCVPVAHEGRTFGMIQLYNSPKADGFLRKEAEIISYIGGSAGEYMETVLPSREKDFDNREFVLFDK